MGSGIGHTRFDESDRRRFHERLRQNLAALGTLLERPAFGEGPPSLGAEVELCITGRGARPLPCNIELHAECDLPGLTLELDRFNLEYNLRPVPAAGRPFSAMERELVSALAHVNAVAAGRGARVFPVGILPTLRAGDFGEQAMTPLPRYRALTEALRRIRGERFAIRIDGADPVSLESGVVPLEGANTSFQVHLRVEPAAFARTYNAAQLATPVVLAVACNSPLLMGRRLWHETRVPLFKLSVDGRDRDSRALHLPPRVDFGTGWVREGVLELYAAAVHLHEPLLPVSSRENATASLRAGRVPALSELRLHMGTLWPWNRPVYDPAGGGHLRIEMRALPAGPSAIDMMANAAFATGLARELAESVDSLLPGMPFPVAARNFYRAAQHGHEAELLWPGHDGRLLMRPARELAAELLPVARRGLARLGVTRTESQRYLGVMERRIALGRSGAQWQLHHLERRLARRGRARALAALTEAYARYSLANLPVSEWPAQ